MSLMNRAASPSPDSPVPAGLDGAIERAVAFAGPYLAGLVARSAPTPQVLKALADELDSPVRASEQTLEQWLRDEVQSTREARLEDAGAVRRDTIDAIVLRCQDLHHVVERLISVRPDRAAVVAAREQIERNVRDDNSRRAETPYRHQELLVRSYELALDAIDEDVTGMVLELTEPILGIGERLVRRYDELVVECEVAEVAEIVGPIDPDQ